MNGESFRAARSVNMLQIAVGQFAFVARLEEEKAPETCAAFHKLLPYHQKIIHARWSGEACWIPLGDLKLEVGYENHTSHPAPGEILFYPGGYSETEILFPYGACSFASKVGQLAGNHFLTVVSGQEQLRAMGEAILWHGAYDITFVSNP
jgi:Protein of unknown function (DUF3830)